MSIPDAYQMTMLQGKDAISFLETLVVGDIASLKDGTGSLSCFTNEKGGIIDDTVITKVCGMIDPPSRSMPFNSCPSHAPRPLLPQVNDQEIYLVVNAGCRDKDLAHIGAHLAKAKVRNSPDTTLTTPSTPQHCCQHPAASTCTFLDP